eukprot:5971782-Pleurochrysis_carterae.AAC.2
MRRASRCASRAARSPPAARSGALAEAPLRRSAPATTRPCRRCYAAAPRATTATTRAAQAPQQATRASRAPRILRAPSALRARGLPPPLALRTRSAASPRRRSRAVPSPPTFTKTRHQSRLRSCCTRESASCGGAAS